jgi:hypothetical protein
MNALKTTVAKADAVCEKILLFSSGLLTPEKFHRLDSRLGEIGIIMAPVTAGLLLALGIIGAVKTDSFITFAASFVGVMTFLIAHWCGRALGANCDLAIANTSTRISGYGLFRSVALVVTAGLISLLAFGVYLAIKQSAIEPLYLPLGYAAACLFLAWFLLNPTLLCVKEESSSTPGDDALSLAVFSMLYGLRLHRVAFGGGLIIGNVAIAYSIFKLLKGGVAEILYSGVAGFSGIILVFSAVLAPVALYLWFVFSYLIIDLMRAILRIGR